MTDEASSVTTAGAAATGVVGTQAGPTAASGKADKYFLLAIPRGLKLDRVAAFSDFRDQFASPPDPSPECRPKKHASSGFLPPRQVQTAWHTGPACASRAVSSRVPGTS